MRIHILSNIESGKSIPNIFHLAKMAEIYELDILDFLARQGVFLSKNTLNPIRAIIQN